MAIALKCPTCGTTLTAPDDAAGKVVQCPQCANRMMVPGPAGVDELEQVEEVVPAPVHRPPPPAAAPRRRAGEEDEYEDEGADDRPRRRRRGRFACPYCGSDAPPRDETQISSGGWVLFVVLLVFLCWPVCWIPLITMKETVRKCGDCGTKLG